MSIIGSNILAGASGQGGGYTIERSLRFRSSASAYLNRTPASAGNQKTWTWSGWFKNSTTAVDNTFIDGYVNISNETVFRTSGNSLSFVIWNADSYLVNCSTAAVFRDPSAWYHIVIAVDTTQATNSSGVRIWVNGSQVSLTFYAYTQNASGKINAVVNHNIGRSFISGSVRYTDGYLTEVNFIDGQALTPDSFGEYDSITGVWKPTKYTGTYGTNGFYLNFSDNTTTTTLGYDTSGNGNNWTANNISLSSGVTYDSMTDTPTPYADGGNGRGNYCVLNPIGTNTTGYGTVSSGNLNFSIPNTFSVYSTMSLSSGKWYWEAEATSNAVGVGIKQSNIYDRYSQTIYYMGLALSPSGEKYVNGTGSSYGATWTTGDVIGVALDMGAGTITFYKNNVSQGVINLSVASITEAVPSFVSGAGVTFVGHANFGQRPFAYTPPDGFKALHTGNLPEPEIVDGGEYFNAVTYTGNGSTQSITGFEFQPDLVWIKPRSIAGSHGLFDAVRGIGKSLRSHDTRAEDTASAGNDLISFNSDGFSVGPSQFIDTNTSGVSTVAWNWKANGAGVSNTDGSITSTVSANTTAGFSIVSFNQTSSPQTIGHGLGVAPRMVIVKDRDSASDWQVYHASLGATNKVLLNSTNASASSGVFNNTAPTSTVFSFNANYGPAIAYCFSEVDGYSKFGSYTGNGSADGPFVFTGHRPRWVMIKRTDTTADWVLLDTSRDPYNYVDNALYPNASYAENVAGSAYLDILSNGFKLRIAGGTTLNTSGGTYIYMAFAEHPTKYSLAR